MKWFTQSPFNSGFCCTLSLSSPTFTKKFQILVPILETLASFEETIVRDQACKSLILISNSLTEEDVVATIVPAILRLAEANWFTNKIAALDLICSLYEKTGEYKSTLRKYPFLT